MMYLFSQIKLTVGGLDMEIISNPGQVTPMLAYLTQPDDYNSNAGLKSCWCKDTTNHARTIKFNQSAAIAAGAIAAVQHLSSSLVLCLPADPWQPTPPLFSILPPPLHTTIR